MKTKQDVLTATRRPLTLAISSLLGAALFLPAPSFAAQTTRLSVASDGTQGNNIGSAYRLASIISADGRFVAFVSQASNLVAGDTNGLRDIFVKDLKTQQTTRVSVASDGTQGNDDSYNLTPSISADGRYVAFHSWSSNLVADDTNGARDIFVNDLKTQQTTRVSVVSDAGLRNNASMDPSISADGRFVAFDSSASNLVAGDSNGSSDIFVKDLKTQQTKRVSLASDGSQVNSSSYKPSISADGRFVAFSSSASNLVAGDTNNQLHVFVKDIKTQQTTLVSVTSDGKQGNDFSEYPSISADGRFVAFSSRASNLVAGDTNRNWDVFVKDLKTQQLTRVSVASNGIQSNNTSFDPSISADGRYVAFESDASNLVAGDTNDSSDIFVKDLKTQQTTRVSVASDGTQGYSSSFTPSISADGCKVTFGSLASNLVVGDTNVTTDVFLHDRCLQPALGDADLSVTQTASTGVVSVGSTFSYTATLQNLSKTVSSGVLTLTDIAPLGDNVTGPLSFKASQGGCSKGPISVCRLGPLAPGQQARVSMDFKALKPGRVSNRVSINSGRIDPVYKNDVAISSVTIK